jgi:DHA2 family multidrug resistance protein
MWSYSFITHDWGADQLLLPQILRGLPRVFAVALVVTLGLGSLPSERLKFASVLFNMMCNLGGAVGIAVSAAVINDQTNLHFPMRDQPWDDAYQHRRCNEEKQRGTQNRCDL